MKHWRLRTYEEWKDLPGEYCQPIHIDALCEAGGRITHYVGCSNRPVVGMPDGSVFQGGLSWDGSCYLESTGGVQPKLKVGQLLTCKHSSIVRSIGEVIALDNTETRYKLVAGLYAQTYAQIVDLYHLVVDSCDAQPRLKVGQRLVRRANSDTPVGDAKVAEVLTTESGRVLYKLYGYGPRSYSDVMKDFEPVVDSCKIQNPPQKEQRFVTYHCGKALDNGIKRLANCGWCVKEIRYNAMQYGESSWYTATFEREVKA